MKRISAGIILLCLAVLLSSCGVKRNSIPAADEAAAGLCGAEVITKEEISFVLKNERGSFISELSESCSVPLSEVQTHDYDGSSFDEMLNKMAFERACEIKCALILMREKGIYEDVSIGYFCEKMNAYNSEHSASDNSAGLFEISEDTFYYYYYETGLVRLREILGGDTEAGIVKVKAENSSVYYGDNE